MNSYQYDVFYDISHLSLETKKLVLEDAKERCNRWETNILNCNKSWARRSIDLSWEEMLSKLNNSSHFVIIWRRGYEEWKKSPINRWRLEIGFSTMNTGPSYYLFIYLDEAQRYYFIDKYKLEAII